VSGLNDEIKNARKNLIDIVKAKLKELLTKILEPLKTALKGKKGNTEGLIPPASGKTKDGTEVEVSFDDNGKVRFSWNPTEMSAEDFIKATANPEECRNAIESKILTAETAARDVLTEAAKVKGGSSPAATGKPSANLPDKSKLLDAINKEAAVLGSVAECTINPDYCAEKKYTYMERPPGGGTWTDYVVKECDGSRSGVIRPHGHHIVLKGPTYPENAQARQILCKYDINPYCACANLVISQNRCHSARYARYVLKALQGADRPNATTENIMAVLKQLAAYHMTCGDSGRADEATDDA
jgi:hypothetical protein